jgi:hypothetical protein
MLSLWFQILSSRETKGNAQFLRMLDQNESNFIKDQMRLWTIGHRKPQKIIQCLKQGSKMWKSFENVTRSDHPISPDDPNGQPWNSSNWWGRMWPWQGDCMPPHVLFSNVRVRCVLCRCHRSSESSRYLFHKAKYFLPIYNPSVSLTDDAKSQSISPSLTDNDEYWHHVATKRFARSTPWELRLPFFVSGSSPVELTTRSLSEGVKHSLTQGDRIHFKLKPVELIMSIPRRQSPWKIRLLPGG